MAFGPHRRDPNVQGGVQIWALASAHGMGRDGRMVVAWQTQRSHYSHSPAGLNHVRLCAHWLDATFPPCLFLESLWLQKQESVLPKPSEQPNWMAFLGSLDVLPMWRLD